MKKGIVGFVVGVIILGTAVYAGSLLNSSDVSYKDTTVKEALDSLFEKTVNNYNSEGIYEEALLNGAIPNITGDLVPVTIDNDGTVHKANLKSEWYSYENKVWANAVILKTSTEYADGATIPENNIDSYFVWIPRYKYKLWNTGTAIKTAHSIEIVFEDKETRVSNGSNNGEYLTHPAFTNFNVNGLWVGKFETTGGTTDIDVKPNQTPLTNQNVLTFFNLGYNYNRNLDSHMMKNTEWGAVAYLSHSKYGIDREVNINNSYPMITGSSALPSTDQHTVPGTYGAGSNYYAAYNTEIGYLASTTGNISGVYDMSGGAWEYMAAYMSGQMGSSGFTTSTISSYSKYFDIYSSSSTVTTYNYRILGDSTGEMGPFKAYLDGDNNSRDHNSWYADYSYFVDSSNPWFFRGGGYNGGVLAGQFFFGRATGGADSNGGFRLVLAK